MHIITRKRLNEFAEKHPGAKPALPHWYRLMKEKQFGSFVELRAIFPSADQVGKLTVFNITLSMGSRNHKRRLKRESVETKTDKRQLSKKTPKNGTRMLQEQNP